MTICEQSIMADAMQPLGQDVDQETADELTYCECHRRMPLGSLEPIVLDLERDRVGIGSDKALVRDRDAVRVAR